MNTTRKAIEGLEQAMSGIDRNVRNLEGITEPLGKRGPKLSPIWIKASPG